MYYVMTKNGQMVGVLFTNPYNENFADISFHEVDGILPDLNTVEWDEDSDSFRKREDFNILTKLQFLDKFTMAERIAITASTDPVIIDIMRMFNIAEYINMTDPKTIQAIQYFMYTNNITPERYQEIIS